MEAQLRELVSTLPAGSKLPSERALALSLGCNFLTVRRALTPLVTEGVVTRHVGSGTFVSERTPAPSATETSRSRLGVLVLQDADAHAYRVLQAVAQEARAADIELSSRWVPDLSDESVRHAGLLGAEGCGACILPWVPVHQRESVRRFVEASPVPLCLPTVISGLEHLCFEEQSVFGAHAITSTRAVLHYFALRGNRRVAFLGPDAPEDPILQKKLSAYACHTAAEKMPNLCGLVPKTAQAMDDLAAEWSRFAGDLAVVAYDDEHAVRFITAMHKRGLSAPTHFRIIGFNNTESSRHSDPPLTTVCQNFEYIGRSLVRSALALLAGERWQSSSVPRTRLLVRGTCGAEAPDALARAALPEIDFVSEFSPPDEESPLNRDTLPSR